MPADGDRKCTHTCVQAEPRNAEVRLHAVSTWLLMPASKRIDKRERRPETPNSFRNSVLSVVLFQTHALALRRELGDVEKDSE